MNSEMQEAVLNELLQEQKEANVTNAELVSVIKSVLNKVESMDQKLITLDNKPPALDIRPLREEVAAGIKRLENTIEAQPKTVEHRKVFQFFPSMNIREYCRVYGNILKWFVLFAIVCFVYRMIAGILEHY